MFLWYIALTHFVLALILFFIVNWLGKRAKPLGYVQMSVVIQEDTAPLFNFLFKVLAPVVYVILLAALFQKTGLEQFTSNIYWVVIYYWLIRLLAVILLGHIRLINWLTQIIYWSSSIALAIWFQSVIDKVDTILPDPKALLEELWLLIIVFLYSIFNQLEISRSGSQRRKERYIDGQFQKLKRKYGQLVSNCSNSPLIEAITYSVMIYENFNRPSIARFLERIIFVNSKNKHSFGIMQVQSDHPIKDDESIRRGIDIIKETVKQYYSEVCGSDSWISYYELIYKVSNDYNGCSSGYSSEVKETFTQLRAYFSLPNELTLEILKDSVDIL